MPATCRHRRKRCPFCRALFLPDYRLGNRQVACSKPQCQRARKQENQAHWLKRHPGYFTGRYPKVKRWLEAHPGYLATYRRRHPDYVASYYHHGMLLVRMGRKDEARGAWEEGIRVSTAKGDLHTRGEIEAALIGLGGSGDLPEG